MSLSFTNSEFVLIFVTTLDSKLKLIKVDLNYTLRQFQILLQKIFIFTPLKHFQIFSRYGKSIINFQQNRDQSLKNFCRSKNINLDHELLLLLNENDQFMDFKVIEGETVSIYLFYFH